MQNGSGMALLLIVSVVLIKVFYENTIKRVFTTQIGFVTIADVMPAVIADAMCIRYSGRPAESVS
jgi:hypothetical protein